MSNDQNDQVDILHKLIVEPLFPNVGFNKRKLTGYML